MKWPQCSQEHLLRQRLPLAAGGRDLMSPPARPCAAASQPSATLCTFETSFFCFFCCCYEDRKSRLLQLAFVCLRPRYVGGWCLSPWLPLSSAAWFAEEAKLHTGSRSASRKHRSDAAAQRESPVTTTKLESSRHMRRRPREAVTSDL